MSANDVPEITEEEFARMTREEKARHGAALDGVDLVEYGERYVPGSPADKHAERSVAKWFLLTALFGAAFVVIFIVWPAGYKDAYSGDDQIIYALYTPLIGLTLGLALLCFGIGIIALAKKIAPHEVAVQQRHQGMSDEVSRQTLGAEVMDTVDKMGMVKRRSAIKGSLALAGGVVGIAAAVPILGGLIKNPWEKGDQSDLWVTPWAPAADGTKVRMAQVDGTPVRPEDIPAGSLTTVFPGVPGGAKASDAAVMLFRLRSDATVMIRDGQDGFEYGDIYAYSKICTHVGCPVSLYEQQTGRILCPCHQSQFDVFDGARPVFGPATRPLPQLHIGIDDEGYLIAESDFIEPVGPGFWESNQGSRPWGSHPKGSES
ncbi:Rieske 2Fe-2S domain-containing protein [Nakamurella sp. YIM 132087]|uniref:Cytochrome bc1 complex Rieske iron-sulfur subunit n=1 Tax=Nakamurella alba TaxID=2665158 RepID=A0A7K1FTA3_9ACTN|nr:Rieske 2Fe-2S domain-containing protein [Nakamurella alba]MTD17351.1 Rieske 2Fe-2S domain-containing protein [Nakamurella alba]